LVLPAAAQEWVVSALGGFIEPALAGISRYSSLPIGVAERAGRCDRDLR